MNRSRTWLRWLLPLFCAVACLGIDAVFGPDPGRAQDDYEAWRAKQQQAFDQYISEQDQQFSNWLEEQWREFDAMQGLVRDEAPKPVDLPVAPLPETVKPVPAPKPKPEPEPIREPIAKPIPKPIPKPTPKPMPRPEARPQASAPTRDVPFFNSRIEVADIDLGDIKLGRTIDEEAISEFWAGMSALQHEALLASLTAERDARHLNDWGHILIIHAVSRSHFPRNDNLARLATWFYLLKSGYDARIGFWENRVHLLLPTEQTLYSLLNYKIEGVRYYHIALDDAKTAPRKMMIFEGTYPGSENRIDMRLLTLPDVGSAPRDRELCFDFAGSARDLTVRYDQGAIDFLDTYPLTDLDVYFTAPLSGDARSSMLAALTPEIDGLPARQAVDLLLRFVQTGFTYKTDGDQFGREKYMFAEEIFHFPYSDCEDRSILFHYLVENLLQLDVVGLSYPGHVATAVDFRQADFGGDTLNFDNRRYVICDPTYINAGAGMCMPQFRDVQPQIMRFD